MALAEKGNGEFFCRVRQFYTLKVKQTIEFEVTLQDKAEANYLIILLLLCASPYLPAG